MTTNTIRVVVADDHPIVRESMGYLFREQKELELIGSFGNTNDVLEAIVKEKPDVVVTDVEVSGPCVFETIRAAKRHSPQTRFLLFSAFLSDHYLARALEVNASGYVLKKAPVPTFMKAIRKIALGQEFYCPSSIKRLVFRREGTPIYQTRLSLLTCREMEILGYVARGIQVKDIATTLQLSSRTVDRHKANIMEKLNIHNQVGLARFALAEGLADLKTLKLPS